MKPGSIVGHVLELCVLADSSSVPADQITWSFYKQRSYLGARDRSSITSALFGMQRAWRYIAWLSDTFFSNVNNWCMPAGKEMYLPLYIAYAKNVLQQENIDLLKAVTELWNTGYGDLPLEQYLTWLEEHREDYNKIVNDTERLGIQYSFPDWMIDLLVEQYSGEAEALLAALNTPARITLRVNRHKISREECRVRLSQEGIVTVPAQISPDGLITEKRFNRMASPAFKEWLYEFQDEGSQLISVLTAPQPGEVVIDACAGGGGKTMHLSEIMQQQGKLIAIDVDMKRMHGLQARIERSNIEGIELKTVETLNEKELFNKADRVLVDAPCSGSGRIRRSPDIKKHLKPHHVAMYPPKQLEILLRNEKFVKPGGTLVYATCSLFQSENEAVIQAFLQERNDFTIVPPIALLQELGIPAEADGCVRILPHRYPTDGFFIAILRRNK